MHPTLDDVQQAVNKATACVLEVSRGVAQWGQQRFKPVNPLDDDDDHHRKAKAKGMTHMQSGKSSV